MVRRKSLQELFVRDVSSHVIYQHCRSFRLSTLRSTKTCDTQKMDLGACPKSHTERLKTEFLTAKEANPSDPVFHRFQMEYEANIFAFVDECDRRIRSAHRRLEKTPEENAKTTNLVSGILTDSIAARGLTDFWV
jgi:hypothetical protein